MLTTMQERAEWTPSTPEERQTVLAQMERIVASPPFCHSRRYPVLLRYVVETTLQGEADTLKERTLGVEVFQRHAAYDTNLDPIVRVTAGEVRKRIAQYYHEAGHDDELRIDLPAGSYVPTFSIQPAGATTLTEIELPHPASAVPPLVDLPRQVIPASGTPQTAPHAGSQPAPPAAAQTAPHATRPGTRSVARWLLAAGAAALVAATLWVAIAHRQSALKAAWAPMLASGTPVLISIGEPRLTPRTTPLEEDKSPQTIREHVHQAYIVFSDVQALSRITTQLTGERHEYRLQAASTTTFADLRQGPAILIGGFDNPWTVRALSGQRFQFARDPTGPLYIADRRNPANRQWAVDFGQVYADLTEDYAIVARFTDPDTHQPVMIVAGIGENGTKAAGELLTDPDSFRLLFGDGALSSHKNFEAVIGAHVINGVSGPPKVLAKEEW